VTDAAAKTRHSIRHHSLAGILAVIFLAGGVGGWAATTEIAGAVVAPGVIVVESNVKKVQHPTGGIVGELLVREGQRVEAGAVLLRLDETVTRASLAVITKTLDELGARQARLEAERDDAPEIAFPDDLLARLQDTHVQQLMVAEEKLFELRRVARLGKKAQLQERIIQLREEIEGLEGQSVAKKREIELMNPELDSVRVLWEKELVPISRMTALEREAVRLEGERNQLIASAAQARGRVSEVELQIIQIDQDLRSEVARELREIQAKVSELGERRVAAEDQLKRIDIRAPQSGFVHQLSVHTVGGVISPAEPIMLIVPQADNLAIEARIPPQNIDQLSLGQAVAIRFAAFNQRTTPEINGAITRISADVAREAQTGFEFYVIRVAMPLEEITRLGNVQLVPGMPVEIFVRTGDRSVLSYLLKPLQDQVARAFRER